MANLREPPVTINPELLRRARWFAGKGREVAEIRASARLEPDGSRGAAVELVDVRYADGGQERYALALRDGRECSGDDPLWPALARAAGIGPARAGRFLADDLSNTVVVLDDAFVLKLYRRPEPGGHPEVELLRALEGVANVPRLLGAIEREGSTLASVQAFLAGTPVGWEEMIARLARGDELPGESQELARVTAELHAALAVRLGETHGRAASTETPELDTGLGALRPLVAKRLAALAERQDVPLQRIHGDLHVGQFLRARDGLVVLDWEGEPGVSLAERRLPRPRLRDLASLRLSLAHAARAAHRRNDRFDWQSWSAAARDEALAAYAAVAGDIDVELLHELEVEKELSELSYAERWLPEWLYVPRDVLPFVLEVAP